MLLIITQTLINIYYNLLANYKSSGQIINIWIIYNLLKFIEY